MMATDLAHKLTTQTLATPIRTTSQRKTAPGGMMVRFFAFCVDIITYLLLFFPLFIGSALAGHPMSLWPPLIRLSIELGLIFAIMIYPTYAFGGSPGKLLFDLRLVDAKTGQRPPLVQIIFRETLARFISSIFLGAGFLNGFCNRERETWHDLLGRTRVIHIETEQPADDNW